MTRILKDKKCKFCKKVYTPFKSLQQVCSVLCGINLVRQQEVDKRIKEMAIKIKKLSEYEAEARAVFQEWVRLRDKDQPCISCGNPRASRYDGGHWWKAEIYSGLIFHEDNCNKQCSRPCNKDLNGDQANYRIGLVKRIGLERVVWLEENKDRLRNKKYTKQELIEIKQHYSTLLKPTT